jgi:hypothetical protein
MTTTATEAAPVTLTLTEEERTQLLTLLDQVLRDTLIEVHRTESPHFREFVQRKETALRSVADKLRQR